MAQTLQKGQTADPGLRPGMAVEVLSLENSLIRVTRVESYQNGAVILRDAKGDNLPRMVYNQELKLRFFHNGEGTLLLGRICGSTDQIWKVDRMESKFFKEQRAFFRQRMTTRALGKCHRRSARGVVAKEGYPCRVLDVSAGGLLLLSGEIFALGDRLVITGLELTPSMEPFTFQCQVRRAGARERGLVRYGCQFEALRPREQDRLLKAIFTVQREEIRLQKEQAAR